MSRLCLIHIVSGKRLRKTNNLSHWDFSLSFIQKATNDIKMKTIFQQIEEAPCRQLRKVQKTGSTRYVMMERVADLVGGTCIQILSEEEGCAQKVMYITGICLGLRRAGAGEGKVFRLL